MKPQFILAVQARGIVQALNLQQGFNPMDLQTFLDVAQPLLTIRQRQALDETVTTHEDVLAQIDYLASTHGITLHHDPVEPFQYKGDRNDLQLLPYRVITQKPEDGLARLFTVYQRGKGVGESRLAGNNSVGFGGHVDMADAISEGELLESLEEATTCEGEDFASYPTEEQWSTIDLEATLIDSAGREFEQEVLLETAVECEVDIEPMFIGLILDRSDDVGCLHLGLVYHIELPASVTATPAEEELLAQPPQTAAQLLEDPKLENWSRIVAQHFHAMEG